MCINYKQNRDMLIFIRKMLALWKSWNEKYSKLIQFPRANCIVSNRKKITGENIEKEFFI